MNKQRLQKGFVKIVAIRLHQYCDSDTHIPEDSTASVPSWKKRFQNDPVFNARVMETAAALTSWAQIVEDNSAVEGT